MRSIILSFIFIFSLNLKAQNITQEQSRIYQEFNQKIDLFLNKDKLSFSDLRKTLEALEGLKDQMVKTLNEVEVPPEYVQMNSDFDALLTLNELKANDKALSCKTYLDSSALKFNEDLYDPLVQKIISKAKNYCNLK